MRVERLVIEAGSNTLTLELHPRLTVLAGMGPIERESLVGELIGSLSGSRPGLHLELEQRSGRHLAVFRPTTGSHRIVDVDIAQDVTAEFTDASGACNLLTGLALDSGSARRLMRFGAADLATTTNSGRSVETLAGLDQTRLWAAADALHRAQDELTTEAEAIGSSPEDAAVIDEVEKRHFAVEQAADRLEATRRRTIWLGGACAVATIPACLAAGAAGLLFILVALGGLAASLMARTRLDRAAKAEDKALADAGANSYLGFQLQRVNGLLANDANRKTIMGAAGARRSALAEWNQLAGEIPVEWALAHQAEITEAARLRRTADAIRSIDLADPDEVHTDRALTQALVTRLAAAGAAAGEGLPLLLDDPFCDLAPALKPRLLELLGRSAGEPQIVVLTEDPDVVAWARLEALTGELALIEPAPESEAATVATRESIRL